MGTTSFFHALHFAFNLTTAFFISIFIEAYPAKSTFASFASLLLSEINFLYI